MRQVGPYRLIRRIDLGGMAEVYLAVVEHPVTDVEVTAPVQLELLGDHPAVGERVAIKRLLPIGTDDDELLSMFVHEVRVAASQHHPGLCPVFAWGWDNEAPFLAMEHIHGLTWKRLVERALARGSTVPSTVVLALGIQVCEALSALHAGAGTVTNGIVHRDISPQNVMVSFDGRTRLIDFGIATGRGEARQTQHGVLKGKLGYMAPEQLGHERLDGRTDIFALGVLLWEALAGRRLFSGGGMTEVMERIRQAYVPSLADLGRQVPAAVEAAVRKALAARPDDRYATATLFREALVAVAPEGYADDALLPLRLWLDATVSRTEREELLDAPADAYARTAEAQRAETTDRHSPGEGTQVLDLDMLRGEGHPPSPAPLPDFLPLPGGGPDAGSAPPRRRSEETAAPWLDALLVGAVLTLVWAALRLWSWIL